MSDFNIGDEVEFRGMSSNDLYYGVCVGFDEELIVIKTCPPLIKYLGVHTDLVSLRKTEEERFREEIMKCFNKDGWGSRCLGTLDCQRIADILYKEGYTKGELDE